MSTASVPFINHPLPSGLSNLCSNVQTILIASLVPSIINVINGLNRNKSENFIAIILIITLIVVSIGLIFYSNYVYKHSLYNYNLYLCYIFIIHLLIGLYIFYSYMNDKKIPSFAHLIGINSYSNLTNSVLTSLIVSSLAFALININYTLYTPT